VLIRSCEGEREGEGREGRGTRQDEGRVERRGEGVGKEGAKEGVRDSHNGNA